MSDVRDFLRSRWSELSAELDPLRKQIENLDLELVRLRKNLVQIEGEREEVSKAAAAIGLELDRTDQRGIGEHGGLTIKGAISKVLEEHPGGLTSNAILDEINLRFFGGRLERTSFSPQLSRLKSAGEIKSEGSLYFSAATPASSTAPQNPRSLQDMLD